jgi:hypothetical protein
MQFGSLREEEADAVHVLPFAYQFFLLRNIFPLLYVPGNISFLLFKTYE